MSAYSLLFLAVPPPVAAPGWPVMAVFGLGLLLCAAVVYRVGKNGERR